jgi:hypothetical protein
MCWIADCTEIRGSITGAALFHASFTFTSSKVTWFAGCPPLEGTRTRGGVGRGSEKFPPTRVGFCVVSLRKGDDALLKVNVHNPSTEEIQSEETVNARAWRKRMSQHWEVTALLPHCLYSSDSDARSVFNPTSSSDLHTVGGQRRVIPYSR